MSRFRITLACLLGLAPLLAHAGHGQDLLIVDEPGGPTPGSLYLVGDAGRTWRGGDTASGLALTYGLSDRWAVQVGGTLLREDSAWTYAATGVEIEWSISDPDAPGPHLGLTLAHDFAPGDADASEVRLGVAGGDEEAMWAANVFVEREDESGENTVGVALGGRRALGETLALALEAETAVQRAEGACVLATLHIDPSDAWALKLGIGGERGAERFAPTAQLRVFVRLSD